ncbi:MAG: outer membrane protein assembly factor BamD [Mariprofundaceae bacterium]|nr:outer membrane protein assembly factor BamD [Mariprofundaceae bacterium]
MIAAMRHILCVFLLCLLSSCASKSAFNTGTAEGDYNHAKYLLDEGLYAKANIVLKQYVTDYPYSKLAVKAELLRIYSTYKAKEFILTETLSESFLSQHPTYPEIPYVKYLLAMSFFKQVEDAAKDQTYTQASIQHFERLLKEHPDSPYAKKGQRSLNKLYKQLAGQEMYVGKYYFDQERYVAAANRFVFVVENYQTMAVIEEAMYYLVLSYQHLDMASHAKDVTKLLRHNYPNSKWTAKLAG